MIYSTFVLLPMFVCFLWCVSLCLDFRSNNNAKKALTVVMLAGTIFFGYYGAYLSGDYSLAVVLYPFYTLSYLAITPLFFIYTRYLSEKQDFHWRYLGVLAPAVFLGFVAWVLLLIMDNSQEAFLANCLRLDNFDYQGSDTVIWMAIIMRDVARVYFAVQLLPLFFLSFRMIRHYKHAISEYYSECDARTLMFTKAIYGLLLGGSICTIVFMFIPKTVVFNNLFIIAFVSLCTGALFFILGYLGSRHNFTFEEFHRDTQTEDAPQAEAQEQQDNQIEETVAKDLATRMQEIMVADELFLKKELRISELSAQLSTNRTYVSQAINQQMGCTFSDYVNSLRVEYAKKLLADPKYKMLTIEAVADMSGFTNSGSMNRSFKRILDTTPHSYRVESLKKISTFVA